MDTIRLTHILTLPWTWVVQYYYICFIVLWDIISISLLFNDPYGHSSNHNYSNAYKYIVMHAAPRSGLEFWTPEVKFLQVY